MTKPTGRGGPGRGQGRHKLTENEPTTRKTSTAPKSYHDYVVKLGGGDFSKGFRELVDYHRKLEG